jgi:hypothetical protein
MPNSSSKSKTKTVPIKYDFVSNRISKPRSEGYVNKSITKPEYGPQTEVNNMVDRMKTKYALNLQLAKQYHKKIPVLQKLHEDNKSCISKCNRDFPTPIKSLSESTVNIHQLFNKVFPNLSIAKSMRNLIDMNNSTTPNIKTMKYLQSVRDLINYVYFNFVNSMFQIIMTIMNISHLFKTVGLSFIHDDGFQNYFDVKKIINFIAELKGFFKPFFNSKKLKAKDSLTSDGKKYIEKVSDGLYTILHMYGSIINIFLKNLAKQIQLHMLCAKAIEYLHNLNYKYEKYTKKTTDSYVIRIWFSGVNSINSLINGTTTLYRQVTGNTLIGSTKPIYITFFDKLLNRIIMPLTNRFETANLQIEIHIDKINKLTKDINSNKYDSQTNKKMRKKLKKIEQRSKSLISHQATNLTFYIFKNFRFIIY